MDDLVSRRVAIDTLMSIVKSASLRNRNVYSTAKRCLFEVEALPTIDAVPVVRCRDCKYSYIFEPWEGKNAVRYCNQLRHAYAKDSDLPVREEGFCSYGERREE